MGHRLSKKAWDHFKQEFPEDVKNLTAFEVKLDRSNLKTYRYYPKKRKKSKTNSQKYGVELGPMIDWLDEIIDNQYYLELDRTKQDKVFAILKIYFLEESDAVGFKLVFSEKDLTKIQL